jgi:hypothetical protein
MVREECHKVRTKVREKCVKQVPVYATKPVRPRRWSGFPSGAVKTAASPKSATC